MTSMTKKTGAAVGVAAVAAISRTTDCIIFVRQHAPGDFIPGK
jgi:hypothetical protein